MYRRDPKVPPKPAATAPSPKSTLTTTGGVRVLVHHDRPDPASADEEEAEPSRRFPDAIILPENQLAEERDAFIASIDAQWGGFIQKELSRRKDVARASTRDLHQTVLLVLCNHYVKERKAGKPGVPENVPAFLDTVIDNAVKNHARKKSRGPRIELTADVDEEPDDRFNPERATALAELREKLERYHTHLTREEAEVFEARELDGMTLEMIAAVLQRPVTTIFDQHARAMKTLRDCARASERGSKISRGATAHLPRRGAPFTFPK